MSEIDLPTVPEEGDFTLDDIFSTEQIRLAEISVYNWGPFGCGSTGDGHTARIHPESTFIIGESEAGKSTLIDAFQVVLAQPSRATFNIAAAKSSKRDRNLVSYIRGRYLSEAADDVVKGGGVTRTGAVTSIVRASFAHGDSRYTCIVVFRISSGSTEQSDVVSIYLAARRDVSIREVLDWYGQGDKKGIEAAVAADPQVVSFKSFSPYSKYYRELLGLENINAVPLLIRALGLKEVDNLTHLIQELVLEPCSAVETAREVVKAFGDARETYRRLTLTRDQRDCLLPLREHWADVTRCDDELASLESMKQAATARIAYRLAEQWGQAALKLNEDYRAASDAHAQASEAYRASEDRYLLAEKAFSDAGGDVLRELEAQIARAKERKNDLAATADQYRRVLELFGMGPLPASASEFSELRSRLLSEEGRLEEEQGRLESESHEAYRHKGNLEEDITKLSDELSFAERQPDSAVEPRLHAARDIICQAVGVDASVFPFVAELIEVKPEEAPWRGAIERALGGLRRTMLVPAELETAVSNAANANHLHALLEWRIVGEVRELPQFRERSMLRKLNWKPDSGSRDWLKGFLARQCDYVCVDSVDELKTLAPAVTIRGLMSRSKGSYRKDDRRAITDDSDWILGFSNAGRIASLRQRLLDMQGRLESLRDEADAAKDALSSTESRLAMLNGALEVQWSNIDQGPISSELHRLAEQHAGLATEGGSLESAAREREDAKKQKGHALTALNEAHAAAELAKQSWERANREYGDLMALAGHVEPPELGASIDAILKELELGPLPSLNQAHDKFKLRLATQAQSLTERRAAAINRCSRPINRFVQELERPDAGDWGTEREAIPKFLEELDSIEREGLPKLVAAMRDRLNEFSGQQLVSVQAEIKDAQDAIRDRIDAINDVLRRTELRAGTYLALKPRVRPSEAVNDFDEKLKVAVSSGLSEDADARFRAIEAAVTVLEKATDPQRVSLKDSLILLDPRHRFDFVAEELGVDDNQMRDQWTSSSGKSGGAKEIFAGTIVAASLAYVLTPKGARRPLYCTVFLDEAFSNTSTTYSGRVIRTFAQLQLHLNLITPLKNIELAREHARSLVLITKNRDGKSSAIREVTWEYIDRCLEGQPEGQT